MNNNWEAQQNFSILNKWSEVKLHKNKLAVYIHIKYSKQSIVQKNKLLSTTLTTVGDWRMKAGGSIVNAMITDLWQNLECTILQNNTTPFRLFHGHGYIATYLSITHYKIKLSNFVQTEMSKVHNHVLHTLLQSHIPPILTTYHFNK